MDVDAGCKSPNFNARTMPVDMVLIHYTGMETAEKALERLCDKSSEVSAHYLIDRTGHIFSLVSEDNRAWHAGVSFWRGEKDQNSRSIGIELENKGHEFGYESFSQIQIGALIRLIKDIMKRHNIKFVMGHSDVAPSRKQDPGELFPWKTLAENGIGVYTEEYLHPTKPVEEMFSNIGYDTTDAMAALKAFRMHFHPESLASPKEASKTLERLASVEKLFDQLEAGHKRPPGGV